MLQDREPNPLNELVVGILAVRDQVARGLQNLNQRLNGLLTPQPGSAWAEIIEAARDGRLQSAVKKLTEELERTRELYESSPFAFVLEWVDFGAGRLLLEGAAEEGEELMLVVMQRALLDPEHLDLTAEAISEAPILGPPQRADLLAAIERLRASSPDWPVACRLLLGGYEGALWLWARCENVIDDERNLVDRPVGRPGYVKGIATLLATDALPLPDRHREYVSHTVFNEVADDIRHGRALAGHRETAIVVLWALDAWLDAQTESRLTDDASQRIDRLVDELAAAIDGDEGGAASQSA